MLDSGNSYDGRRNAQGLLSMLSAVVKWKICSGEGYLTYFGKTFETFYIPVQLAYEFLQPMFLLNCLQV